MPDPIKRAVQESAEGRCEFVAENGRRCADNRHAAEQMYGRAFMDRVRRDRQEARAFAPPAATPPASPSSRQQSFF